MRGMGVYAPDSRSISSSSVNVSSELSRVLSSSEALCVLKKYLERMISCVSPYR